MARSKPVETVHQSYGAQFDQLLLTASRFWPRNVLPEGEPVIVVDLLMQDIRVALRNLTLANAIRRVTPARIVALVGPDPDWNDTIWQYYDIERMSAVATAYGACDVVDMAGLVDACSTGEATTLEMAGHSVPLPEGTGMQTALYEDVVEANAVRVIRIPRVTDEIRETEQYARIRERSKHYARIYDAMFGGIPCAAFITSHIDYSQWGMAVDAGMRHQVPVVHVQSTGDLKAYTLFPDKVKGVGTYRMEMTQLIAEYFEENVWRHRAELRRPAELTTWRAKVNLGRPSWWRGGGSVSQLEFRTAAERASVRVHALRRFGLDPDKPVVAVFNHAVSDAVKSNFEIFDDLGDWFGQTVEYAAQHPEANWLFLDHPAQAYYDRTENFEHLAEEFGHHEHLVFRPSMELSKNVITALVDMAVTVRGSVSNEFPAYGVPALQAGWSEWSHCGFTMRADTREEYWQRLGECIHTLRDGGELITPEQIERARLWAWYYRCASDVVSPLTPHWESGQKDRLYLGVKLAMSHIESEGDPAFVAARRMWTRHEPFLMRNDLTVPTGTLADALGLVTVDAPETPGSPA